MLDDYNKALKRGEKTFRKDTGRGRYPYLPVLDEIVSQSDVSEEHVGLVEVPIENIRGTKTKGRTQAFSSDFMPILSPDSEFAAKWSKLYDSALEEGIREPIKAFEYMRSFYVQEGNKRVSVSSFLGVDTVLADVTRLIPKKTNDPENRIYFEFLDFYRVAPLYDIAFSKEGGYAKLAGIYGLDLKTAWPREKIEDLRSDYNIFRKAFKNGGGDRLDLTTGDAFLVYLRFYGTNLMATDESLLRDRIKKLWDEFVVSAGDDSVEIVEHPEEVEKTANVLTSLLSRKPSYSAKNPLKVAFMYERPADTSGWIYGHELGRNYIAQKYAGRVITRKYDDCANDTILRKHIDEAVSDGTELIFTVSPIQMNETLKSAVHFPDVKFFNCSVNLSQSAVRTYYGRMYEAKFLMGFLAGTRNRGHRIGYLASYPIFGTVSEINAFAIGASMADPDSEIYLAWSSVRDLDWRQYFKEMDVDLISGVDFIKPNEASREYGLYRIKDDGSIENLAFPLWDWGRYYELIIDQILDGTWDDDPVEGTKALNYWWGISAGVIDVILSPHLPYQSYKLIDVIKQSMQRNELNPFYGEIWKQGHKRIKGFGTPKLSNEEILTMTWLNDNIFGCLPIESELNHEAVAAVKVSGTLDQQEDIK
ncbi:MAG: BMP family ABC transporter substrate-binding protein [Lachnospiraceae bacterium]|uniref:BMP family ABC transporter substrate-binding protein n=1 Tax=Candidatus Weimeria bifida TaxID=2599074 RepID=A0A6N7IYS5_9FIRM|nr:BMP family ABC transporter substrate-binding protein [Candidatus Weimeria bifida]RRF97185.1 MAG: BMP family ABC transporter substrate-binding protein [Lachnospiraceae bacterium]